MRNNPQSEYNFWLDAVLRILRARIWQTNESVLRTLYAGGYSVTDAATTYLQIKG